MQRFTLSRREWFGSTSALGLAVVEATLVGRSATGQETDGHIPFASQENRSRDGVKVDSCARSICRIGQA
jgi:hypothetical protein